MKIDEIFDKKISIYKNAYDKKGRISTLRDFLFGHSCREEILVIRQEKNADEQKRMKLLLPQASISGTFSDRTAGSLIEHSGLICIDIDGKDNPTLQGHWEELKLQLGAVPQIAYISLSVRGNGLFCIIPLAYPDLHNLQFLQLEEDFKAMGINIDPSCKNVNRLRIISYDPHYFFRDDIEPYKGYKVIEKVHYKSSTTSIDMSDTIDKVARYCAEIDRKGIDITATYDEWFQVGSSLASLGEAGREFFHIVSRQNAKYDVIKTNMKFDNILQTVHKWSIGTFFYMCQQGGVSEERTDWKVKR